MTLRYVDTGSTAGGNGTTTALSGANRAYASRKEALDALTAIGTLADAYTIELRATGGSADALSTTQTSWNFVTSTTNYLLLTVPLDHRHQGVYDTSKYRCEVTNEHVIYNNQASHVRLDGLQFQITGNTSIGNDYNCYRLATANNASANIDHRISNCIAKGIRTGTDHITGFINSDPTTFTGTCRIWNCLAHGCYSGFQSDAGTWATNNLTNYNCTAWGNDFNYQDLQICKNCLSANPLTGDGFGFLSTGSSGHTNNASDESSAVGTNARINQTFSFVNTSARNFALLGTDTGALDFGVSNPGSGLYGDDIRGYLRTGAWDIGAFEYIPPPIVASIRRGNRLRRRFVAQVD